MDPETRAIHAVVEAVRARRSALPHIFKVPEVKHASFDMSVDDSGDDHEVHQQRQQWQELDDHMQDMAMLHKKGTTLMNSSQLLDLRTKIALLERVIAREQLDAESLSRGIQQTLADSREELLDLIKNEIESLQPCLAHEQGKPF